MLTFAGIELDFRHSRIVIDGRGFPAVVLTWKDADCVRDTSCETCPLFHGCVSGGGDHTNDPEWAKGWSVYVPAENGALFAVGTATWEGSPGIELHAYSATLDRTTFESGDPQWHPAALMVAGRSLVPFRMPVTGPSSWTRVEPEWLADTVERLSRFEVPQLPGRRAKLVPISDLRVRPKGTVLL